jgi:predicted RNA-binding protein YlxR (DUF448 family)
VAPKPALVRLALDEASGGASRRVVIDRRGIRPGRGAYLCRDPHGQDPVPECLERALRRGGLARAFRCAAPIDPDFVESTY